MKRKFLNGCALSLAIACGNSLAWGQMPYYGKAPLYSGTSLGSYPSQYVAYNPAVQANPYASYYQEQVPTGPAIAAPQLVPGGVHQHIQPMQQMQQMQAMPQGQPGTVSPLPPVDPQPMGIHGDYQAQQAQPVMQYGNGSVGADCQTCQQPNMAWSGGYAQAMTCGPTGCGGHMGHGLRHPWLLSRGCGPTMCFGGIGGLIMQAEDTEYERLTYDSNMPTEALMTTQSAEIGPSGGFEVFFGRYFNCGRNAIMASYWSLLDNSAMASVMPGPGENLRSDLPFTTLGPGGAPASMAGLTMPAQNVYDWYDAAAAHRLRRSNSFNNLEVNLLGFGLGGAALTGWGGGCCDPCGSACGSGCGNCIGGPNAPLTPSMCSRLRFTWLAGIRWFQFKDAMEYATSETDNMFGTTADDFYYRNYLTNDLIGLQVGGIGSFCVTRRISLFAGPKFGIYGNNITYDTYAGTTNTPATVVSSNAYNGMPYDLNASTCQLAFLGEFNTGIGIRLTRCWSAYAGYRAIGATGVATATGMIPMSFANVGAVQHIDNTDSLLLHGAFFGGAYNF